jgi:hypothetical protein
MEGGGTTYFVCSGCHSYQNPALRPTFALYQTKGRGRNAQLVNFDIALPCSRKGKLMSAMLLAFLEVPWLYVSFDHRMTASL